MICENLNQPDLVSIDSLPKEIFLKTKSNYSLLCSVISLKEGHFVGIYYMNEKYFLLDDLVSTWLVEITNDLLFKAFS